MRSKSGRSDRTTGQYRERKGSGPRGLMPISGLQPKCRIGPRRKAHGHPTKKGPGR